ncbi:MAG: beta-lactamase family protein [Clostridia bacterium]|nr:beta-lactamase family protein [Clostridia bacterium]
MKKEAVEKLLEKHFRSVVQKDPKIQNAFMLIHSEKYGIHLNMAQGITGSIPADPQQPYYIASIGKLFISVLTGILFEKKKIAYDDFITQYLEHDLLDSLHIYKGIDYTERIKIKHLLNHTSGLSDYFEDQPKQGKSMLEMIVEQPSRSWSPQDIIHWSKKHLKSHFPPGRGFHYSDTGYHILGLILEKITGMPLHEVLEYYIFNPLDMHYSYMVTHLGSLKQNSYPAADVYIMNTHAKDLNILKSDYAGGGIVAPAEDLLKFMNALKKHEIIGKDTFEKMKDWAGFFNLSFVGINYGYGLMSFKTIPFILPSRYNAWGNIGSIGSFMFYHPLTDTFLIGNLNHFRYHRKGIQLMFKAIDIILKCHNVVLR